MARRFRFRLETVRRLRRQARDAQRRVVADAVRAATTVELRVAGFVRQLQGALDHSRGTIQPGRMDVASIRRHQIHRSWLHRQIDESNAELGQRRQELDAQRDKLAEASRRLEVIELLREKRWRRYLADVAREEQTVGDEAALQGYLRGRRESTCETAS